jgi:CRISPR-associated endonuclease/helicase Cas3
VQTLVDTLPPTPGLTLIEAPTGSGKTEAALACAWRLLAVGRADSIIFALPTQATANAMLKRAEAFAALAFGAANVVLAHGKRRFHPEFQRLVDAGRRRTAQGEEEAAVQCSAWLAHSRKRVFLGQIGVCTVDQTLLSVLPVRHKFVRGFGINKSVFIVDEVHAYDSYMHGLLAEVLRRQKDTSGSAILLSATLPSGVRSKLLDAWGAESPEEAPYPAAWHATGGSAVPLKVPEAERPALRVVAIECVKLPDAFPDDVIVDRIVGAAERGARVAVVLNLVDHAQRLARVLRPRTAIPVDIFHARYRFADRQAKETWALGQYGREAPRDGGRILVATQVVEQSVDLDFDWLVTQICPVDLLFQRLGRRHRHDRPRPPGFESPHCMVISVEREDYGYHNLIYENTRVLWRTDRLLQRAGMIVFPGAYRNWIEAAYGDDFPELEPERITRDYREFTGKQLASQQEAKQMINMPRKQYSDDDDRITIKTRDGEMSLTVLPVHADGRLLDGQALVELDDRGRVEAQNMNAVPVPASWGRRLIACDRDDEGRYLLKVSQDAEGVWVGRCGEDRYRYTEDFGSGWRGSRVG